MDRVHRRGRGRRRRSWQRALGADAGFFAVYRPHGRAWRPGERVRLPALAATLETLAHDGFDAFYEGDLGARQERGLATAGSAITAADLREHTSTWGDPIAIDYRGTRVTTHPPNSSGIVALELLGILRALEPPDATAFGPDGVTDPRWIHVGIEAAKLAMADRDRYLTDPGFRDVPVDRLLDPDRLADLAARIDPARVATPPVATNPPGGGTIYLAVVDAAGNAVSLIESNYLGFGSGVVDPDTGVHYQNRGSYFSLDPDHPNVLAPRKRTLHTLLPGMLFRDRRDGRGPRPWVVAGSMGGDAQPQIHAQLVSALVDGGVDIRTAVAAPRWYVEPADHFMPPTDVRLEPRHVPGVAAALAALGHRPRRDECLRRQPWPCPRDRTRGRRSGDRRRLRRGRDRPAQRGAARRLVSVRAYAILGGRWQAALTRRRHRSSSSPEREPAEEPVTSNVSQNYPYTSETETDRAATVARLVAERDGLAGTLAGECDPARRQRALVGLEVPIEGVCRPPPRRRVRDREARGVRRVRRHLREDLPALTDATARGDRRPRRDPPTARHRSTRHRGVRDRLRIRLRACPRATPDSARSRRWR